MTGWTLDHPGSRALVAGTARHVAGSALPDVPAVAATVRDFGTALVDCCGLAPTGLGTLLDPADPAVLGREVAHAAAQARGTFLFSFTGHGLLDADGELYLATAATDSPDTGLRYTALPYSAVREALLASPAESIVVVLDCCFAGRADGAAGGVISDAFGRGRVRRSHLLASASRDERALAPAGAAHTAFTGCLMTVLREGDALGPRLLTLEDVSHYLDRELPRRGLPQHYPQHFGRAGELVLTRNRAYEHPEARRIPPARVPCPYRGLAPFEFTAEDARYFAGRAELVGELLTAVEARRSAATGPLVVTGASGSGKSSALRAGLLPALQAAGGWLPLLLTPGERPMHALVTALNAEPDELAPVPGTVDRLIREVLTARAAAGARLLLVVDQFEEVFARCRDDDERNAFISALCAADPDHAQVVLAVRADFYGHCLEHPGLVGALGATHVPVGPMAENELRQAITEPAATAGLALESGLVELLLHDMRAMGGDSGAALPLLAHALLATWRNREGKTLTIAGYHSAGGIWQSVATSAEKVFEGLAEGGRPALRQILLNGVQIGDGTDDTRRTIDLPGLLARAEDADQVAAARDALVEARLITLTADGAELAHEALLRAWPRLRGWIDADRDDLRVHQRLTTAAAAWHGQNRDSYLLYRSVALETAHVWAGSHDHDIAPVERDFLRHSTRARGRRNLVLRLGAALGVLLLVAAVGAGVTVKESRAAADHDRRAAERDRRSAISGQLVPKIATQVAVGNPLGARKLAVQAHRLDPDALPAASALLNTQNQHAIDTIDPGHYSTLWSTAYSPDGRTLAIGSANGLVDLWDSATKRRLASIEHPAGPGQTLNVTTVAFSPDGRLLAATMSRGVRLWEITDRAHPRAMPSLEAGADVQVAHGAFSKDGRLFAAVGADGGLRLWDVARNRRIERSAAVGRGSSLVITPDGRTLVVAATNGTVRLWDVRRRAFTMTLTRDAGRLSTAIALSPDGGVLAVPRNGGGVLLWDLPRRARLSSLAGGLSDSVMALAFSPDGSLLAGGNFDHHVKLWDLTAGNRLLADLNGHIDRVNDLDFSPDGTSLASASADGTVQVWDVRGNTLNSRFRASISTDFSPARHLLAVAENYDVVLYSMPGRERFATFPAGPEPAMAMSFNADGSLLATGGRDRDGTVRVWDVPGRTLARTLRTRHHGQINALAFSPDGLTLATSATTDPTVLLWNPRDGALRGRLRGNGGDPAFTRATKRVQGVQSLAYSPDGTTLAVGAFDGKIRLWNTAHMTQSKITMSQSGSAPALLYSPDGRTLASGGAVGDTLIHLWDPATGASRTTLQAHTAQVNDLVYSPDGRTLISAGNDRTARIWNLAGDPLLLATLTTDYEVAALAYDPAEHTVVTTGIGPSQIWSTDPTTVARRICTTLSRPDLTPAGWKYFIPQLPYEPSCAGFH